MTMCFADFCSNHNHPVSLYTGREEKKIEKKWREDKKYSRARVIVSW